MEEDYYTKKKKERRKEYIKRYIFSIKWMVHTENTLQKKRTLYTAVIIDGEIEKKIKNIIEIII